MQRAVHLCGPPSHPPRPLARSKYLFWKKSRSLRSLRHQASRPHGSVPEGTPAVANLNVEAGRVEVRQARGSSYLVVANTTPLGNGDAIRTGPDGTAVIHFLDDTETTLFPNTVLVIDAFNRQSDGSYALQVIQLIGSTFNRVNFTHNNSTQQIATPYGVASVRGTGYWVEVVIDSSLANTLLQQELEEFIAQAGLDGSSGDFNILVGEIMRLLGVTPGTASVDVGNGTVTFTDLGGNSVSVTAGFTATSGTDTSGSPIVVTITVLERFCGDSICDAYLDETSSTCTADC